MLEEDHPPSYDDLFDSTSTTVVDSGSLCLGDEGVSAVLQPQDGKLDNYKQATKFILHLTNLVPQ